MQPLRRNRIGTKASELWSWEVEDIKQMKGPLAVQEYIQELISTLSTTQETTHLRSLRSSSALPQST